MSDTTNTLILLAALGGGGFLLYKVLGSGESVPKKFDHKKYQPLMLFTNAMSMNKLENDIYWGNRKLDPQYVPGEAVRFSPDFIFT